MIERLLNIDRRIIFVFVLHCVQSYGFLQSDLDIIVTAPPPPGCLAA